MIQATRPTISRIKYRGNTYKIYDAYPQPDMAEEYAYELRTAKRSPIHPFGRCGAIAVDLGPEAGRLRYGVFVRWIT